MWKSTFYGAFVLNHRVVLHAIDATPARRRGDAGSSPLDRARTAASSPRNDLVKNSRVHPKHWLISTQVLDEIIIGGLVLDTSITNIMGGADDQNKLHKSSLSLLTSGPKKTQIGARPGTLSGGYQ